jgi:hypothetical protein
MLRNLRKWAVPVRAPKFIGVAAKAVPLCAMGEKYRVMKLRHDIARETVSMTCSKL